MPAELADGLVGTKRGNTNESATKGTIATASTDFDGTPIKSDFDSL